MQSRVMLALILIRSSRLMPGLRGARGDDDHVRVGGVGVVVGAFDMQVEALDRAGLEQVEPFALRHTFDNIDKDDIASSLAAIQCGGGTNETSADDGNFRSYALLLNLRYKRPD